LYLSDTTDESGRFGMVTIKAQESLHKPAMLADVRADKQLQDMALVRHSRFSVTPVTATHFDIIMEKALSQL
jgi:predicted RNA-binding protein with PUA-like domain